MKPKRMVSVAQFLEELKACGGSCSRTDLLRRWKNGNMTSAHLDALIAETGCACIEEATGGRHKIMVVLS